MKKLILKTALLACVAIAGNAQAAGVSGQGTWETTLLGRDINGYAVPGGDASSVFLYDTVLKITWLRNANANDTVVYGYTNWPGANTWAANLVVGAYDDWRLPTMIDTGTLGCNYSNSGTDCGYNVQTTSDGKVYSEMASLWYDTLGNKGDLDASGAEQAGSGLTNSGDFQNLQTSDYWLGLEYAPDTDKAWTFGPADGYQGEDLKVVGLSGQFAMAVRPGDVLVPAVPEPETYALMLAGLAVVGAAARRRKAK